MSKLLGFLVGICSLVPVLYCFEPTNVRIRTADDVGARSVDLQALRKQSIDSYLLGSQPTANDLNGMGSTDLATVLICSIVAWSLLMMLISYQCQKSMLKDFYKLHGDM